MSEVADDFEARTARHHHVDERDVRPERLRSLDRLLDRAGLLDVVIADPRRAHELEEQRLVVADQDPRPAVQPDQTTRRNTRSSLLGLLRWIDVTVSEPRTL